MKNAFHCHNGLQCIPSGVGYSASCICLCAGCRTRARDCRVCGGSGWTDGSAKLRRDSNKGSTECIACKGSGKEVAK
jgi:hypothetical protein